MAGSPTGTCSHYTLCSPPPWVISKPLLCCSNESMRWFLFYMLTELLPKGVLQPHLASHRLNHVLTQTTSSMLGSLSISNFGNKWLKRIYWLLRVGFTSPTFSHSEIRCQEWPGHLGFSRRIWHRRTYWVSVVATLAFFSIQYTGNTGIWLRPEV